MPWGFGIPNFVKNAYNNAPDLGISSTISSMYNAMPPMPSMSGFNPYASGSTHPAILAAQSQQPESMPQAPESETSSSGGWGMPSLGGMASGLGSALYNAGSAAYNGAPDLGVSRAASGLGSLASNVYQSLPTASSVGSTVSSLLGGAASGLGSLASTAMSGAGSLAGRAASAGISALPDQTRSNMFQHAGSQLGSQLGSSIGNQLPFGMGDRVNDYATNFGRKFGDYAASQFSNNPQSSFGGFKNLASTLGGGGAGALGGAGLGSVGGSALGGYLGGKLGKHGASVGKLLGGLAGGALGALGGGLGGGYLGNKFTGFERGGVVSRRSTNKMMYNGKRPRHGMPRR